jgi:ferric-dicitrate binding protein FerR (iron transport regulator)
MDEVTAWKDGRFSYTDKDLESIMRQVARWYDAEVVFEEKITDSYTVEISRSVPLSRLLGFLELSGGVHFSIEGRRIIVRK